MSATACRPLLVAILLCLGLAALPLDRVAAEESPGTNAGAPAAPDGWRLPQIDADSPAISAQAQALLEQGSEQEKRNNPAGARDAYRRAVELAPKLAPPYAALARLAESRGERTWAITLYQRFVALDHSVPEAYFNLGRLLAAAGRSAEARRAFESAVELAPELARAHLGLGSIYLLDHELDKAIGAFQQAIDGGLRSVQAYVGLANALRQAGRLDEAVAAYERALDVDDRNSVARLRLAETLKSLGRRDEAADQYRELAKRAPHLRTVAFEALGDIAAERGDLEAAEGSYQNLVDASPDYEEGHVKLADVLRRRGKTEESVGLLMAYLESHPQATLARRALLTALADGADRQRALELARRIVANNKADVETLVLVGDLEIALGDPLQGAKHLEGAARLDPSMRAVLGRAAAVYVQFGQLDDARRTLAMARDEVSWDLTALRGYLALLDGDDQAAAQAFEEAQQTAPEASAEVLRLYRDAASHQWQSVLDATEGTDPAQLDAPARLARALAFRATGRDGEAVDLAEPLLARDEVAPYAALTLAQSYLAAGQLDLGREALDRRAAYLAATRKGARVRAALLCAGGEGAADDATEGLKILDELEPLDPPDASESVLRLGCLAALGRWQHAGSVAEDLARQPDLAGRPDLINYLAWVLYRAGARDRALDLMEELTNSHPEETLYRQRWLAMLIAAGRADRVVELLDGATGQASTMSPDQQLALADALATAGRLEEARQIFQSLLAREREEGRAHAGLALLSFRQGNIEDARQQAEQALAREPTDPAATLIMARIIHDIDGNPPGAAPYLRRYLDGPGTRREAVTAWLDAIERIYGVH